MNIKGPDRHEKVLYDAFPVVSVGDYRTWKLAPCPTHLLPAETVRELRPASVFPALLGMSNRLLKLLS